MSPRQEQRPGAVVSHPVATAGDRPATIGAARRALARRLAAGLGQERGAAAGLEARLILAHALGRDPAGLVVADDEIMPASAAAMVETLAARRLAGEPVARLLGAKEFWSLPFALSPDTLVPRPDTETLVAAALAFVDAGPGRTAPLTILDLGTGSGAIVLALLSELPGAFGIGTDRAPGAVATARANAAALGLAGRAAFLVGHWADAIRGPVPLICANPPYIRSRDIDGLAPEVRDFDPRLALDGGPDGLAAYRAIIADLGRLLAPDGAAFLEIGAGQAAQVARLGAESGLAATLHADLAGTQRVVVLRPVAPRGSKTEKELGIPPRSG